MSMGNTAHFHRWYQQKTGGSLPARAGGLAPEHNPSPRIYYAYQETVQKCRKNPGGCVPQDAMVTLSSDILRHAVALTSP